MKKRKQIQKKMKKIIEYIGIRLIAFFIFNFPIFGYVLGCYLTNNI